ncbi:juvenile hormone acid O-methyltransferase-like [Homalodisca vitripennis]|uniref:juvenile hormone acid O-methyltransferase-like n=1 Tax=Homalodisca vitripennis TaxID=197043 RepID=UPI001EE9EDFA|nr:juvenile hormone acid O-methyltransferase-like [Homalodisca vitripennis]XP_046668026.1 juvenile hormone acid O-methyltransferase-like [Homalodisca vitripennis]KAG8262252.1 hypothetical protein J6590_056315 [Homalodisca vitripennis]
MQKGEIYEEFNEKSAKYRELSNILTENEHLLTWTDGERIVDVGCGPGDVTTHVIKPWLPADYSLLLGLDISPKMTQHGLTHHADDRVTFDTLDIGSDISHFMLNDEYSKGFDKIISFYVMNWVRDLPTGVKNLFKLLKPGGQALLMFPVNRNFQKTYRIISDRESWREYFKNITRNISPYLNGEEPCTEFQDILKESGFEIVKCETHQKHDVFDSVSVLKELIESLDQYISCVPSELKTSYLDECVQVMTEMKALEIVDGKALVSVTKIVSVIRKPTA